MEAELGLPRGLTATLAANGVTTVDGLVSLNERQLLSLPRIGPGALQLILERLAASGLTLSDDPWARYECARDGRAAWDVSLASFFLCDECTELFETGSFDGQSPVFVGGGTDGLCSHCNLRRELRLRQWLLCSWCERILRSIGRSVVSARFVMEVWETQVQPDLPGIVFREIDAARLLRRSTETMAAKVASADFEGLDADTDERLFEIELKTGRGRIGVGERIGAAIAEFQLDHSDCDDILIVAERDAVPVYLAHAQVIDRVAPPTIQYSPAGLWWTDLFSMRDNFRRSARRPRETKIAAYYNVAMFKGIPELIAHLKDDGPRRLRDRVEAEGLPRLYELP